MESVKFLLINSVALETSDNYSTENNCSAVDTIFGRNVSSNQTAFHDGRYVKFLNYVLCVLAILITLAAIIGNFLVIFAVISEKRLRKVGNIFIINLAVSDCLVGLVVSPLAIAYDITNIWVLGETACDIWVSLDMICCTASILNLCAIAYDRCNAIVQPIKYSRKRTFKRAGLIMVFVWTYSSGVAVPRFLGWRDPNEYGLPHGKCHISTNIGYTFYSTFLAFFIPLLFMLYFYWKIYSATCVRSSQWYHHPGYSHYKGQDAPSDSSEGAQDKKYLCKWCLLCLSREEIPLPDTQEQATQTNIGEQVQSKLVKQDSIPEEDISRRESIEPELLAIYQMRQRSTRILSNATMSSFNSTFYSSTDSSNTATTSFSESSDRSSSISTEPRDRDRSFLEPKDRPSIHIEPRDRSMSSSTESGRSFSSESFPRKLGPLRGARLSSARQSSLQQEVIHEIASAAHLEQLEDLEEVQVGPMVLRTMRRTGTVDTDDTHDEMSDDGQGVRPKSSRKLKSSTFRRRNSRKSRKIAISQENRAAKTLGIVMGCFVICWLPFFVITLVRVLCVACPIPPMLFKLAVWLGYFNSACNPFIYTFFNKDFRIAFRKLSCFVQRSIVYL
ncbi:5-hydroxytryptamine receptor 1A-like [Dreissena polymorpha]|uniref:G-protein coupled receptors family 1 profile domain-containing protein n=1 Tax=Dreissena polymorpha TaxID=45954 RepID=A0A9D4EUV6_DREPO|nr:5-hydroxytryptamine receptor 1A-like [Dreissena polymorpha]KAH3787045.1 hypothetical protein DPMN_165164 [Dreissena polymorpha]